MDGVEEGDGIRDTRFDAFRHFSRQQDMANCMKIKVP